MMLAADEQVVRLTLYPQFLGKDGELSEEAFVGLSKAKSDSYPVDSYVASVGRRREMPATEQVHTYGLRSAEVSTTGRQKRKQDRGEAFNPDSDGTFYFGYYGLIVADIINLQLHSYEVQVVPNAENGLIEHCHVLLIPKPGADKLTRLKDRGVIVSRIMAAACGPVLYEYRDDHPASSIKLPAMKKVRRCVSFDVDGPNCSDCAILGAVPTHVVHQQGGA